MNTNIHIKNEVKIHILNLSLCLIFYISDFHNLKIVNNIFFLIFEGGIISLSRGIYEDKFKTLNFTSKNPRVSHRRHWECTIKLALMCRYWLT